MHRNSVSTKDSRHHWYILYTRSNFEVKVSKACTQKEICVFLPTKKVVRQWSDRKKTLELPLIPNYLFVYTNNQNRLKLFAIPGVLKYVSFGGKAVTISEQEINNIKSITEENDVLIEENFVKGSHVEIINGPFTGLLGTLFERQGKTRFAVRFEGINHTLSIAVCNLSVSKLVKRRAS